MYNMYRFNLLDLYNDALNIMVDYVKKDDDDRMGKCVKNMPKYIKN